jgi:hypothetical protein
VDGWYVRCISGHHDCDLIEHFERLERQPEQDHDQQEASSAA